MSKRTRALEPGSRPVECCCCPPGSPKVPLNLLKRHTKSTHGPPAIYPPRTKDAVPIQDFFAKKAKKPKIEKTPKPAKAEPQSAPESNSKPQNSSWLTSLLNILNTFISLLKLRYKAAVPFLKFLYKAAAPLLKFRYIAALPLLRFRYKAAAPLLKFRYRAASPLQCQIAAFDLVFAPWLRGDFEKKTQKKDENVTCRGDFEHPKRNKIFGVSLIHFQKTSKFHRYIRPITFQHSNLRCVFFGHF